MADGTRVPDARASGPRFPRDSPTPASSEPLYIAKRRRSSEEIRAHVGGDPGPSAAWGKSNFGVHSTSAPTQTREQPFNVYSSRDGQPEEGQSRVDGFSESGGLSRPSRRGSGGDTVTVRRREANRLAAQRFRSRKKGYQESLEEKVRELQEENMILQQRLERVQVGPSDDLTLHGAGVNRRPLYFSHLGLEDSSNHPAGQERDSEIRMSALESANRKLQEEVRGLEGEVFRLSNEVQMWRHWSRQHHREGYPWPNENDVSTSRPPAIGDGLPFTSRPSNFASMRRASGPSLSTEPYMPPQQTLPVPLSIPQISSTPSSLPPASSVRLPPIRLTPPRGLAVASPEDAEPSQLPVISQPSALLSPIPPPALEGRPD